MTCFNADLSAIMWSENIPEQELQQITTMCRVDCTA